MQLKNRHFMWAFGLVVGSLMIVCSSVRIFKGNLWISSSSEEQIFVLI